MWGKLRIMYYSALMKDNARLIRLGGNRCCFVYFRLFMIEFIRARATSYVLMVFEKVEEGLYGRIANQLRRGEKGVHSRLQVVFSPL